MSHSQVYLNQVAEIAGQVEPEVMESMVAELAKLRDRGGRLFFIGVGGSAANCSHAVNDFRKLAGFEAYSPADNVAELTARTNDEGWDTVFVGWLRVSRASDCDGLFVLSVGGGNSERNVSTNIVAAVDEAKRVGMKIFGLVGRDGGHTASAGDHVLIIPTVDPNAVTPHVESFQAVLWHGLVTHPTLLQRTNKWEGIGGQVK